MPELWCVTMLLNEQPIRVFGPFVDEASADTFADDAASAPMHPDFTNVRWIIDTLAAPSSLLTLDS